MRKSEKSEKNFHFAESIVGVRIYGKKWKNKWDFKIAENVGRVSKVRKKWKSEKK